jgi:hypothetical protein
METPPHIILYHATRPDNVEAVLAEGLKPGWGGVFLCEDPVHAAQFVNLGTAGTLSQIAVFAVDVDGLEIAPGGDHSVGFFGHNDSLTCQEAIGPERIVEVDLWLTGVSEDQARATVDALEALRSAVAEGTLKQGRQV